MESQIKGVKKGRDQHSWCPFYRGVRLTESHVNGVKKSRDQLLVSVLQRCPSYRESNKGSKERQGPTLGAR